MRKYLLAGLGAATLAALTLGIFRGEAGRAAEEAGGGGDATAAVGQGLKEIATRLDKLAEGQEKLLAICENLRCSKWEYRVESLPPGGVSREKLQETLAGLGKEKFELTGQTPDGLYIFKRRVAEEQ